MDNIKVSVIMPSLNVHEYVKECVESVINQTLKEIEIIFIDAGSTDGTLQILEEYASKDDRIVLLKSDIGSYGHQANTGIKQARGEYIGIVETDDFIDPKMYEELYMFASELNADVVKSPYYEYYNDRFNVVCYYAKNLNKVLPDRCFSCKEYGHLLAYHASVWSGLYRRDYLVNNNIYFIEAPGAGYVDVGFRYDSCVNTEKCAWYKKPYYYYRINSANSSTNNFHLSVMIERWHELHVKTQTIRMEFNKYYAPYLIFDEYLNTIAYLKVLDIAKGPFEQLKDNISYLDRDIVLNSPVMNQVEKMDVLSFMDDPEKYVKRYKPFRPITRAFRKTVLFLLPKGSRRRIFAKKIRLLLMKKENETG